MLILKVLKLLRQDNSEWHFFTRRPWKQLPDGIGENPMRRLVAGEWQYRASTDAEAEEELLSGQW